MATTRRPHYTNGSSNLVDSTEAARMLRLSPHDPLFRRYDLLRASGRLRPVSLDPVRFNVDDVRRLAATPDDSHVHLEDPLRPMRGVLFACAIGGVMLGLVAFNAWYWIFR